MARYGNDYDNYGEFDSFDSDREDFEFDAHARQAILMANSHSFDGEWDKVNAFGDVDTW